jgi:hypothetical protein
MACPFTEAEAGEHSRSTTAATSSGLTNRPEGLSLASMARESSADRPVFAEILSAAASRSGVSV